MKVFLSCFSFSAYAGSGQEKCNRLEKNCLFLEVAYLLRRKAEILFAEGREVGGRQEVVFLSDFSERHVCQQYVFVDPFGFSFCDPFMGRLSESFPEMAFEGGQAHVGLGSKFAQVFYQEVIAHYKILEVQILSQQRIKEGSQLFFGVIGAEKDE